MTLPGDMTTARRPPALWRRLGVPVAALLVGGLALGACSAPARSPHAAPAGAPAHRSAHAHPVRQPVAVPGAVGSPSIASRGTGASTVTLGGPAFQHSLSHHLPADLVSAQQPAAGCPGRAGSAAAVAAEERRTSGPGISAAWRQLRDAGPGTLAVYLSRTSVVCGDRVGVHVGGPAGAVRLEVWRMGWYGGDGGRLVQETGPVDVGPTTVAGPAGPQRTARQDWPQTAELPVTSAWVPGVYLVLARPVEGGRAAWAPLVVRDDQSRSALLVDMSDLTWAAYDTYGGTSLYFGPGQTHAEQVAARAYAVPLSRPTDSRARIQVAVMDLPLVRLVERLHLPVSYTTDTAFDATPSTLLHHAGLVFGGHPEYWTRRMYDAVEAARDAGVNVAFLGANDIHWQARLAPVIGPGVDAAQATVTVYRQPALDPESAAHPARTTTKWRDAPLLRDPTQLVGQTTTGVGAYGGLIVNDHRSWVFEGTSTVPGQILPEAVGNETDGVRADLTDGQPGQLDVLLASAYRQGERSYLVSSTYYSTPSGAGVFSAGTTFWLCHTEGDCPGQPTPALTRKVLTTVTENVLRAFARPRAGRAHPSRDFPALPAGELLARLPDNAVVTLGSEDD
ncbi:MAG TPA: N,N-dimethylformamidase beta subunit family domain-containing protein [Motilibacteraceae bacterium]|nr:N,N-dimethylformamidase beta subunit family domain-containing protein [Motilibacteraceae bacterium]